ncbi:MAG: prenyltransferase, partial [Duncaniella sp.]|nr:prenyltransferase [Duncaniella sp.]
MTLSSLIRLLRPLQWAKNLFVFIPMFFSGNLLNAEDWVEGAISFVCFSMVASGVYCLNDLKDVEADRLHPTKRLRPIASGEVSVGA